MASVINTNIASLNAQRNLTSSQEALATSLQRLSSGLRINSAKDDAAGLAISDRFTTQIRGLNQAARNANDAISLSQTAEGALGEVTGNLQRIRELAVQSANATNSASDRAALDLEVQQRLQEIDRIASQTSFNGQKVLDGTFGNAAFQVGANVGETITLDLSTSMRTADIGSVAAATSNVDLGTLITAGSAAVASSYTSGQLNSLDFSTGAVTQVDASRTADAAFTLADFSGANLVFDVSDGANTDTVTLNTDYSGGSTIADVVNDINAQLTTSGITVSEAAGVLTFTSDTAGAAGTIPTVTHTSGGTANHVEGATTAAGVDAVVTSNLDFEVDGNAVSLSTDHSGDQAALITEIQADLDATAGAGVYTVAADGAAGFSITSAVAGATPATTVDNFSTSSITGASGGTVVAGADAVAAASITVAGDFSIQLGDSAAINVADGTYTTAQSLVDAVNTALGGNATAELDATTGFMTINSDEAITITGAAATSLGLPANTPLDTAGLTGANITTVDASNDIIRRLDSALTSISDLRSTFGAVQNRFESTITNLSTSVENLSASRSRIMDADFAAETAELSRAQILQQAGTAMLSQANAIPQNVLSLLQG